MKKFEIGEQITVVDVKPLSGNNVAPPLTLGNKHRVFGIVEDKKGNQHIDVGLDSEYNFIRSHETKEELPGGDTIHWCHPSRFERTKTS